MSLQNNIKTLLGTAMQSMDRKIVLGDSKNYEPVILLSLLIDMYSYALAQYNAGNLDYKEKVKSLIEKINELRYKCPQVCLYKDKLIISSGNTPPVIEDNIILITTSTEYQTLAYEEVIHNYFDAEEDGISQVIIASLDNDTNLLVDDVPATVSFIYPKDVSFKMKFLQDGYFYLFQNEPGDLLCLANHIIISEEEYNAANGEVLTPFSEESEGTVMQTIDNQLLELPNDTIIYTHIDTSSLQITDQEVLAETVLEWWEDFQIDNPDFNGSLLINTVDNDVISTDFAPGRNGRGKSAVLNSDLMSSNVEDWLQNPTEALLRQNWKEGGGNFNTEEDFFQYITNKSVIVLSFVDEAHDNYHGGSGGVSFNSGNIVQPTVKYSRDYINFVYKISPYLRSFKGIVYPVSQPGAASRDNFLLHAMAAIEGTILSSSQIDFLLGSDKVQFYSPTNMDTKFYTNLASINPYSPYGELKNLGWSGNFTKSTPAADVFSSQEFKDELDNLLTAGTRSLTTTVEESIISSVNAGNILETSFQVVVKDDNSIQPLFSNVATITVKSHAECEETPTCGINNQVNLPHKEDYIFVWEDFTTESDVNKIKVSDFNVSNGQLKLYNLVLNSFEGELILTKDLIDSGALIYYSNTYIQNTYNISFSYLLSYEDSINYCDEECTITVVKLENTNIPPTIVTQTTTSGLQPGVTEVNALIDSTISYTGEGGYSLFWTQNSGPTTPTILPNPTSEDISIEGLVLGTYVFKITVITEIDNFIVEEIVTLIIS